MSRTSSLAVLLAAMVVVVTAGASRSRQARQASKCGPGEPCISYKSCPFFADRLSGRPTRETLTLFRNAKCDNSRSNPKVCCPDSNTGPVTPVTPSPTPSPTPRPNPTPGPTVDPSVGERLLPAECGGGNVDVRIFNGEDATMGEYPWMAILGFGSQSQPTWGCGGALITERYVLTAAHCLDLALTNNLPLATVRLGEHNLGTDPDCVTLPKDVAGEDCVPPAQDFTPEQTIRHPSFNNRGVFNDDIGLIRLNRNVNFNSNIKPICLPPSGIDVQAFISGSTAITAGWGRTEQGINSLTLKKVKLPFVDLNTCNPLYQGLLVNGMMCFGGDGERDACFGDSGGPLFISKSVSIYTVIGVVSTGMPTCGVTGVPAIYTNVGLYRTWITQNLRP